MTEEAEARGTIAKLVEQGKLTASCPFEGMDEPWTATEKEQLRAALSHMFGWKEKLYDPVELECVLVETDCSVVTPSSN